MSKICFPIENYNYELWNLLYNNRQVQWLNAYYFVCFQFTIMVQSIHLHDVFCWFSTGPCFMKAKKNNMMSWQHAIHLLKVLMTGNIWKKKWLFWMTHEYTRCPIQLSQSKVFNWQHQKALISSTNEKIMLNARSIIKVFALLSKAI